MSDRRERARSSIVDSESCMATVRGGSGSEATSTRSAQNDSREKSIVGVLPGTVRWVSKPSRQIGNVRWVDEADIEQPHVLYVKIG